MTQRSLALGSPLVPLICTNSHTELRGQEKEALEAEIKYREMELDLAAVEVEELAAAVETRLKEVRRLS